MYSYSTTQENVVYKNGDDDDDDNDNNDDDDDDNDDNDNDDDDDDDDYKNILPSNIGFVWQNVNFAFIMYHLFIKVNFLWCI